MKKLQVTDNFVKHAKEYAEDITETIQVLGVNSLNDSSVTIRIIGKSKPLSQWTMERELRKALKIALDEANIEIPYQKLQITNYENGGK